VSEILTNTERFQILSKLFLRQRDIQLLLSCSQSKVSELLRKNNIIDLYGIGYPTATIEKKFKIDREAIERGMQIEQGFLIKEAI